MPEPVLVEHSDFTSDDADQITEFIGQMYADNSTRFAPIGEGARFTAAVASGPGLGTDRVRTSIDYEGTSAEGFWEYVFFVINAGTLQISSTGRDTGTMAATGDVAFYPLATPIEFDVRGVDITTIRLPVQRVHQLCEDMFGTGGQQMRFHGIEPVSRSMHQHLGSVLRLAAATLTDAASPSTTPLVVEELTRTVAATALHTFPHTGMTRQHITGPGRITSAPVRRAMDHMDAHAHLPLQIADIAAAAGTSARALQYGFRRHANTTPLAYLRRVRLHRAHLDLQRADPKSTETVRSVAARWGFLQMDRFTTAYRIVFGAHPRDTLRS